MRTTSVIAAPLIRVGGGPMGKQILDNKLRDEIRVLQAQLMPDVCTIQYPSAVGPTTAAADGSNVGVPDNQDIPGSTVSSICRINPVGNTAIASIAGGRIEGIVPYSVSLPWNTVVDENATILFEGQVLQILAVLEPESFHTAVRCICKRLI